ncbi:MAG: acyltransferase [Nitrospirota bacterium]
MKAITIKAKVKKIIIIIASRFFCFLSPFDNYIAFFNRLIRQAKWKAKLECLGENTNIYPHVVIHSPTNVTIGNNVAIAEFVHIWGNGSVSIGDHSIIATHSIITSVTHNTSAYIYGQEKIKAPVIIGERVWIGSGAIILPGVTIEDGAIVGAGSIVTKNVKANTIVVGNPARFLRSVQKD